MLSTDPKRLRQLTDRAIARHFPPAEEPPAAPPKQRQDAGDEPDPKAAHAAMRARQDAAWKGEPAPRQDADDKPPAQRHDGDEPNPAAARAAMIDRNTNAWRR